MACDQCFRCKVGCTGDRPVCSRCERNGNSCTYSTGKKTRRTKSSRTVRSTSPSPTRPGQPQSASVSETHTSENVTNPREQENELGNHVVRSTLKQSDFFLVDLLQAESSGDDNDQSLGSDLNHQLSATADSIQLYAVENPSNSFPTISNPPCSTLATPEVTFGGMFSEHSNYPYPNTTMDFGIITGNVNYLEDSYGPGFPAPAVAVSNAQPLLSPPPSTSAEGNFSPTGSFFDPSSMQVISKLYECRLCSPGFPNSIDTDLNYARESLAIVLSHLPPTDSPPNQTTASSLNRGAPTLAMACIQILHQVVTCYIDLESRVSMMAVQPGDDDIHIGNFQVRGKANIKTVIQAIVAREMKSCKVVITRLRRWSEDLSFAGGDLGGVVTQFMASLETRVELHPST